MQAQRNINANAAPAALYSVTPASAGYAITGPDGETVESTARGIAYGAACAMAADLNAGRAECVRGVVVWEGEPS